MSNATIGPAKKSGGMGIIEGRKLRELGKVVNIPASDGVLIPIPAHFIGPNAEVRVDGNGTCSADVTFNYLVTILNSKNDPSESTKKEAGQLGDKLKDGLIDDIKDRAIDAGLKLLNQKDRAIQYIVKGRSFLTKIAKPTAVFTAIFLDASDTGKARESFIQVKLENGSIASIICIG